MWIREFQFSHKIKEIKEKAKQRGTLLNVIIELIRLYLTVQNKVIQSETPQGTVQQHSHTIWDIINPSVCYMHHKVKTSHCWPENDYSVVFWLKTEVHEKKVSM